ncbi:MAG: PqqD family protein [Bryobacterales bacterium]|nr:PqqD family protein [Bryobacterales bacterium]
MSDKYIARSTGIAARKLGEETIIIAAETSSVFTLNEQATVVWEAADGVTPLRTIVEGRVCQEFDVTPEAAYRDAEELVTKLRGTASWWFRTSPLLPPSSLPCRP